MPLQKLSTFAVFSMPCTTSQPPCANFLISCNAFSDLAKLFHNFAETSPCTIFSMPVALHNLHNTLCDLLLPLYNLPPTLHNDFTDLAELPQPHERFPLLCGSFPLLCGNFPLPFALFSMPCMTFQSLCMSFLTVALATRLLIGFFF